MSQVTGPGVSAMMGDVEGKVVEAQASYDTPNISLCRMALAIAGFRLKGRIGGWANPNSHQKKFAPFDLDSYERGDLEMAIDPRPLIPSTAFSRAQKDQAVWTGVKMAVDAGVPLEVALENAGWTPEKLAKLAAAKQKEQDVAQAKFEQQQKVMAQNQPAPAQNGNQQQQDQQNKLVGQKG